LAKTFARWFSPEEEEQNLGVRLTFFKAIPLNAWKFESFSYFCRPF
jgi:hypothetical protein